MIHEQYAQAIQSVFTRIETDQLPKIEQAAAWIVDAVAAGGAVHVFDTGHIVNSELINRAGGLALLKSLKYTFSVEDPIRPRDLSGKNRSIEGLAELVLRQSNVLPGDILIVGSVSGKTINVIDLVLAAKKMDVKVIVITSAAYSSALKPDHSSGYHLYEIGDLVIDNCAPPGDAMIDVPGLENRFGPASGLSSAYLMWLMSALIVEKMLARGMQPTVFKSINQPDGPENYQRMVQQYAETGR